MRDVDVEALISIVLRAGVAISITVILAGMLFTLVHHPNYLSSRPALGTLIDGRATFMNSVPSVLAEVRAGHGQAIAMVGILLLIATPVARVAISVVLFAIERDRLFVGITALVLVLLLLSLITGLGE